MHACIHACMHACMYIIIVLLFFARPLTTYSINSVFSPLSFARSLHSSATLSTSLFTQSSHPTSMLHLITAPMTVSYRPVFTTPNTHIIIPSILPCCTFTGAVSFRTWWSARTSPSPTSCTRSWKARKRSHCRPMRSASKCRRPTSSPRPTAGRRLADGWPSTAASRRPPTSRLKAADVRPHFSHSTKPDVLTAHAQIPHPLRQANVIARTTGAEVLQ